MSEDKHMNETSAKPRRKQEEQTVVKKYANRRLYNTATSIYITLEDLKDMIQTGEDFVVVDAKTNEDITHGVLTQIILEQENKGGNLLPLNFLKSLIGFYGNNVQTAVPQYLEIAMEAFKGNQDRWQDYLKNAFNVATPFGNLTDINRKNMEVFESAIKMMMPFSTGSDSSSSSSAAASPLADMQKQIRDLQEQILKMGKK